jgi:glycosyltransferase involved in cell wall biosynthesis
MKKILIIAQYFPPAAGVGTFRVTKFVKFLPEFDWLPVVVSAAIADYKNIDNSLEKDLPNGLKIYRLPIFKTTLINDEGMKWIPTLLYHIGIIIKKEKPDVLYMTAGPFFPLVVTTYVNKIYKIPYIIDFRDVWTLENAICVSFKAKLAKKLSYFLEKMVINSSFKTICATEIMNQDYSMFYPEYKEKFITITNGFDPDDFDHEISSLFDSFTILYTGKFRANTPTFRDPLNFFKALDLLKKKNIPVFFVHIGEPENKVIQMVQSLNLNDRVSFIGFRSYIDTLAYTKSADILLIIGGTERNEQTGKIFDYIACKKPILALARTDGGIGEIVKSLAYSKIIENKDCNLIADVIENMYINRNQPAEIGLISKYERRTLTANLVEVLNSLG